MIEVTVSIVCVKSKELFLVIQELKMKYGRNGKQERLKCIGYVRNVIGLTYDEIQIEWVEVVMNVTRVF